MFQQFLAGCGSLILTRIKPYLRFYSSEKTPHCRKPAGNLTLIFSCTYGLVGATGHQLNFSSRTSLTGQFRFFLLHKDLCAVRVTQRHCRFGISLTTASFSPSSRSPQHEFAVVVQAASSSGPRLTCCLPI